jgi:hypothetical protein
VLPACLLAGSALAGPAPDDAAGWLAERDSILSGFGLEPRAATELPETHSVALGAMASVPPQVVGSDVRLALTQMALAAGSAGQAEIAAAQAGEGPGAIYLRAGSATLAQLFEATRGTDLEPVLQREGERYVVSRPLVVIQGAALRLEPGDQLELDTASGAFLLNFGHLSISGATIRAEAPPPESADRFRPFVASLGTGTIEVAHGVFVGLGSRIAPVASGLALSSGSLFAASTPSVVRDSHFIDVHGLSALDSNGAAILGNRFDRARGVAIWADGSDRVTIAGNHVVEPSGAFAIRVDGPAKDVGLFDNVLVGGEHAGLRIAGGAAAVDLQGNVVTGFAGRAIVAEEGATCLRVAGNLVQGNGGDGIGARDVGAILVGGNAILDNGGAGLSLSRARAEAGMLVQDNLFAGNRSGIRASQIATLELSGNDLSDQMPRHLAGDLAQLTPMFLRESRGGARPAFAIHSVRAEVAQPLPTDAVDAAFEQCRVEAGS